MTTVIAAETLAAPSSFQPLDVRTANWLRWLSGGISFAMLVMVFFQIDLAGLARIRALMPSSPFFWLTFATLYFALPLSELVIFRRLWALPISSLGALVRKRISNEILLGYSGEVYFYAWARNKGGLAATPFGAIKDVSILSALVGNTVTLVMLLVVWPFVGSLDLGRFTGPTIGSAGIVIGMSLVILLLGRRIFTLSRRELRFVFGVHLFRILLMTAASGLLWHLALSEVPLSYWLLLATLQLLVSRLPLIPNKDLLFATITVFLIGHDSQVTALMAMIATLTLTMHLVLGGLLALTGLLEDRKARIPVQS